MSLMFLDFVKKINACNTFVTRYFVQSENWYFRNLQCNCTLFCNCGPSYLESHSPQCVCVCPGNATVCGCEWTSVGCTAEGTLAATGWKPTAEEDEGGEEVEVEMAAAGATAEERAGPGEEDEVGESDGRSKESDGRSKETSVEAGGEEEGEDT